MLTEGRPRRRRVVEGLGVTGVGEDEDRVVDEEARLKSSMRSRASPIS